MYEVFKRGHDAAWKELNRMSRWRETWPLLVVIFLIAIRHGSVMYFAFQSGRMSHYTSSWIYTLEIIVECVFLFCAAVGPILYTEMRPWQAYIRGAQRRDDPTLIRDLQSVLADAGFVVSPEEAVDILAALMSRPSGALLGLVDQEKYWEYLHGKNSTVVIERTSLMEQLDAVLVVEVGKLRTASSEHELGLV